MGTHVIKLNKVPLFARKLTNINVSMSAAQKLTLVTANRGVKYIYVNVSAKFHYDWKRFRWGFISSNLTREGFG